MKAASLKEIKTTMEGLHADELLSIILRLGKFKKENKELLTYLLFEAGDEENYIREVTKELDFQMLSLNKSNLFLAKKTIRKVVRTASKFIRYSGKEQTQIEILLHVCNQLKLTGINLSKSTALANIQKSLVKKITASIETLHEDLQYDYLKQIKALGL
ncbi:MAG: hypothetical protein JSU03_09775 [Bacteroidetes bacterium]|nr:hypothetical protein [Bacteroidota bacterium]MBS1757555.1 hypothetical protein [Bacteroidota bacterium]